MPGMFRILPLLLLWPALATVAGAQDAASEAQTGGVAATGDYLARMDLDGDRRISLAEYQAWMSYAFDGMDRNGDGVLSAAELPGGKGRPITRQAHLDTLAARFSRQDANRDGYLDAKELAAPPR
ncbi:hypothetical protein CSC70_02655 [Pseudoxanthomonas kalamensis DSM 18571]|uniref:hypothetical protein n=1 Tax=Pseudoxanthomonas kalamensis TaxID=289483 RepID=UPI001390840B|nr:hypothetical protein [Pseudoxanthomonas kalamensis]KAF1712440.1 hypothetical protein CSC70_02655 [Pseudoxanthomonas kalamensis DSM 18571]